MTKQKFLNIFIWAFLIAGLILILGKKDWFPDFYSPKFFGLFSFVSAFLIILPSLIFRADESVKKEALLNLRIVMAVSLLLNGLGSLGLFQLYKFGFEYDKVIHFGIALMLVIPLSSFIFYWYGLNFKKSVFMAVMIMISAGFVWELLEYFADLIFGTKTFGVYGTEVIKDTILDLVMDFAGAGMAIIFLFRKKILDNK